MNAFSVLTPPAVKSAKLAQTLCTLGGADQALTIANIAKQHKDVTLVVTADTPTAIALETELNYLLSE